MLIQSDPHRLREKVTVTTLTAPKLSSLDRCDRCGAQAYVRVTLGGGGELLFCAHHARQHEEKLREMSAEIHDESERLGSSSRTVVDED
ncbi:hypothetical protein GEV29_14320 [Aeromicrobium sp. SMF47]|uniref:DUF7455 domain-containing protein n=1 Tax=Aeromicrobium TaxID=2040 RepID=UPI00129DC2EB|nr:MULTISPECIES: hypothetical protein [Aeromicrobium]MRJ77716.1 hypothetical protein [Aeromicrobium yanjiei]MRK02085.1 hypothetical protein [Aeromicrobium sp. S22]